MIQTAPAAHTRYLSSPAEATLHGKIQGFVLRLPPQKKTHATFMQPLQCVLQHDVADPHASTHMATPDDNNHATKCDLQPQIQETHRTTHTGTTTGCRTQRRNRLNSKRSKPHPPHTQGTFHRRLTQLYTEKYKVSCSSFLPKRKPMQHSCSHYNVFYSMTWLTRMHLRTWQHQRTTIMQPFQCDLQLQIQETHRTTHTGTTTGCRTQRRNRLNSKRSKPHPPHTRGTFHRRLKPLYTEKYKVSCSGFLPKTKPLQHHAPLPFMVASSLPHHSPSSSLSFFTTSLPHHFPSSPLPFIITSLLHHFPSSPLPFVTTPLHHHFPSSPLPFIITSLLHRFPSSPLPFFTTSLPHHL